MATIGGSNIATDGLVLALDAANPKSYLPGINLIRNSEISGSAGSSLGTNWGQAQAYGSSVSFSSASFGIDVNGLGYTQFNIVGGPSTNTNRFLIDSGDYLNLPSSSTFTFSYNYSLPSSFLSGSNRGIRAQFLFYSASVFQFSSTSPIESGSGLNRASYTFTTTSSFYNSARIRFDFYRDSFAGENVNFTGFRLGGVQLEQQPTATPYIITPLNATSSRTIWTDLSGNNYSGSLVNGPIYSSANNGSFTFDGVSTRIDSTTDNIVPNSWTVGCWVINTKTSGASVFIAKSGGPPNYDQNFVLQWETNKFKISAKTTTGVYFNSCTSSFSPSSNSIYNVVGTFDSNTTTLSLYVNGVLDNTKIVGSTFTTGSNLPVQIGCSDGNSPANFARGTIYNTQIHNRALTALEVLQNYNALKSRYNL
jgi:hypothetical protein